MKTHWTEEEENAILDELIDAETLARFGITANAYSFVAMALGLSDGDVVEVDARGRPVLSTPPEEILANIEAARRWRASGKPLWQLYESGVDLAAIFKDAP